MSWIEGSREQAGSRRLLLGTLALALACGAMLVSAASASAVGSVSGTVTDVATEEPIEGVEVCAHPADALENEEELEYEGDNCELTDLQGEYSVANLENDEYVVEFWGFPVGYESEFYDDKGSFVEADPVSVDNDNVPGVDAELESEFELPPSPPPPPPVVTPVLPPPPPPVVPKGKAKAKGKKCKKGFRPKKVKGKKRCVKIKKRRGKGKRKGQRRRG